MTVLPVALSLLGNTIWSWITEAPLTTSMCKLIVQVDESGWDAQTTTTVWSSPVGIVKRGDREWEIDIPVANIPADQTVHVYASDESRKLSSHVEVGVSRRTPTIVKLLLKKDTSAKVRGVVVARDGSPLARVRVWVDGYPKEAVVTDSTGEFRLPAHLAPGEPVLLFAQREGGPQMTQKHVAGRGIATIEYEEHP